MVKKAKLYSLLAVIVVSTVVGLFGFSEIARAQSTTAQFIDKQTIQYNGEEYKLIPQGENGRYGLNDSADVVYLHGDPDDPDNQPVKVISMIASSAKEVIARDGLESTGAIWNEYVCSNGGCEIQGDSDTDIIVTLIDPSTCGISVDCGDTTSIGDVVDEVNGETAETPQSCQIKGIGWLVCPIVNFLAVITDQSYNLLNKYLLKLEPIALPGSNQSTERMQLYDSWRMMRDFANIVFIIGFLIIVFSQITSIGIGNYGIKRLLPKIIIAAILVNLSYYICAVAVDLSNILGNSLRDALMPNGNALPEFSFTQDGVPHKASGFVGISDIVLGAVLTGAIVYAFLPVFLPLVVSAALAVITAVIVLTLRQALVVILIVISPLAFVALLLPNTENYFQKWRSLFTSMLLIYPIISVVFGASALASSILMNATDDFWTQMVGAGVSVIPLFITPILMKVSGGLLNRWVGIVNDPTKGPIDGMRNSLRDRGTLMKAGRAQRTAGWVNSNRGSRVLGGANSWRRRAAASMTNYGSNNRERKMKDNLAAAESNLERAYLGTEDGQAARNATKNAQINLQNSQINTETIRLNSAEGLQRQIDTTSAERRQETAKNDTNRLTENTLRGSAVNSDLKESEVRLHTAENRSQAAATGAVSHTAEAEAMEAEFEKKAAENEAQTAATRAVSGGTADRDQRRSELELQAAKTRSDANWAGQTENDPALRDLTQEVQTNQAATSVVQGVAGRRFNARLANPAGAADVQTALGGVASPEITAAIDTARAEAEDKEINRAQQALQEEVAQVRAGTHATFTGTVDRFLEERARTGANDFERGAAMYESARLGRSEVISGLQNGRAATATTPATPALPAADQARLRRAVDKNAGALIDKAPDIVKGTPAAGFGSTPGSKVARFAPDTMERYADYLVSQITTGSARDAANAESTLDAAINDILTDSTNLTALDIDAGNRLRERLDTAAAANPAVAARVGTALRAMRTNAKFTR